MADLLAMTPDSLEHREWLTNTARNCLLGQALALAGAKNRADEQFHLRELRRQVAEYTECERLESVARRTEASKVTRCADQEWGG